MSFIKSDRVTRNSLYAFSALALAFFVSLLLNLTALKQIFILRQFIEYIPYCLLAAAFAFLIMVFTRLVIRIRPTHIFYLILFVMFAIVIFDKIAFFGASHEYDIFRVTAAVCGLFCDMVIFDKFCDADLNKDQTPSKKYEDKFF